jgi:hypothetical protein
MPCSPFLFEFHMHHYADHNPVLGVEAPNSVSAGYNFFRIFNITVVKAVAVEEVETVVHEKSFRL